mmetsp:Transcript_2542/g.4429  ORF Transcript_2542/g.4429 Transcript_2542/m.4429 type:complete len:154 (-) Transcript_2542:2182-2643(-)
MFGFVVGFGLGQRNGGGAFVVETRAGLIRETSRRRRGAAYRRWCTNPGPGTAEVEADSDGGFYSGLPPVKVPLTELELAEQRRELTAYADELKRERIARETEENKLFGWTANAETINGRFAMFFLTVGILTEYWTGQSIPEQVITMLETLGVI